MESPSFTLIIPTLNEAPGIDRCLKALQRFRSKCEVLVVDGGSSDATVTLARPLVDKVLIAPKGRARQMNAGAKEAHGEVLIFLHADTFLPNQALDLIAGQIGRDRQWGRFDLRLDDPSPIFWLIAFLINWRSRLSGISTGDQTLFVSRAAFDALGGYPEIELMEDIAFTAKLRRFARPINLDAKVLSSARRWRDHGIARTIVLMWWLRLRYFFGASPQKLAACYQQGRLWML